MHLAGGVSVLAILGHRIFMFAGWRLILPLRFAPKTPIHAESGPGTDPRAVEQPDSRLPATDLGGC